MGIGVRIGLAAGLLFSLVGCGGSAAYNEHASFSKEEAAVIGSLTEAFKSIKYKETARAALPGINATLDRYEKLPARARALPKVTASELSLLEREYRANLVTISLSLENVSRQAILDSRDDKDTKAAVRRMNGITKDISKGLWDAAH